MRLKILTTMRLRKKLSYEDKVAELLALALALAFLGERQER